jgi:FixJ family two-component response regulator/HPt (histidine-containing phosphotransfer) domain-containing protein
MSNKNRLILVLDDDPTISIIVRGILQSHPFDMRFVSNIERAKEALKSDSFDVFLTDIHLPDGSSLNHLEEYFQLRPDLKIIVMTKFNNEDVTDLAWKKGAVEFLEKPIQEKHLLNALDSSVNQESLSIEQRQLTSQLFHFVHDRDIPVFEGERLVENMGGDTNLCRLALESFFQNRKMSQDEILDLVKSGDDTKILEVIHRYRGTAETVTAFQIANALRQMKKTLDSGGVLTEYDCHELNRIGINTEEQMSDWISGLPSG